VLCDEDPKGRVVGDDARRGRRPIAREAVALERLQQRDLRRDVGAAERLRHKRPAVRAQRERAPAAGVVLEHDDAVERPAEPARTQRPSTPVAMHRPERR
jgi:hypothetical protein